MEKIRVIAVVGPTASGKTALGVKIAGAFGGEVVSADSMQIYKDMPIASAAPDKDEMQGIPHHLIGFADRSRSFSVAEYVKLATGCISEISQRGKIPVIVGGTGLYIDSLLGGITFADEDTSAVRLELEKEADAVGTEALLERLRAIDPKAAEKLHANDRKRIIRGLEVFAVHGKTPTELNLRSRPDTLPYETTYIGLSFADRDLLYKRIEARVDIMLQKGLLREAERTYLSRAGDTSVQAIGHKELFPYFAGTEELAACVESLKTATRRYAKRQLTWFRKNETINWINADETDDVFESACNILEKAGFDKALRK